jgi:ComF family protein
MGKIFGSKLNQHDTIVKDVDLVIPVPLHWKKLKTRGYNQCDPFAQSLAETLNVPFSTNALERTRENISQTKRKRYDRWGNVAGIFSVIDDKQLAGKHILLVDDVVTTGATAEACLQTILAVPATKVSFVAMAYAVI